MKFTDLNAHGGIGANCSLCEIGPFKFVVDSGLHPKFAGPESLPKHNEIGRFTLDFIILTHCHLDHLGSLPSFQGNNRMLRSSSVTPVLFWPDACYQIRYRL